MTRFLIHTDVTARELDPMTFTRSVPQLLAEARLTGVQFKQAFICNLSICHCVHDRKIMCVLDGPDEDAVRSAMAKIELPITAILAKPS
jgi:hypothetical protein